MARAMFEIYRNAIGEYRFRLRTPNGEPIAFSTKGYRTKAGCCKAVDRVMEYAPISEIKEGDIS